MKLWPFGKDGESQDNATTTDSAENTSATSPVTEGKPAGGGLANFYQHAATPAAPNAAMPNMSASAPASAASISAPPSTETNNKFDFDAGSPTSVTKAPEEDNAFNFDSQPDDFSVENLFAESPAPTQPAPTQLNSTQSTPPPATTTSEAPIHSTPSEAPINNSTPGTLPEVDVNNFVGTHTDQATTNNLNHMAFISKNGDIWDAPDPNHQPDDLHDAFSSTSAQNPTETLATPMAATPPAVDSTELDITAPFTTNEAESMASNHDLGASAHNADLAMGEFDMTGFEMDTSFDHGFNTDFDSTPEVDTALGFNDGFDTSLDDGFTPTASASNTAEPAFDTLSAETTDDPFADPIGNTADMMMADFAMPEVTDTAPSGTMDSFTPTGTDANTTSEFDTGAHQTVSESTPQQASTPEKPVVQPAPSASAHFDMAAFLAPPADDLAPPSTPSQIPTQTPAQQAQPSAPTRTPTPVAKTAPEVVPEALTPVTQASVSQEPSVVDESMMPPSDSPLTPVSSMDEAMAMAPPSHEPMATTTHEASSTATPSDADADADLMPPDFQNHSLLDMFKSKPAENNVESSTPTPSDLAPSATASPKLDVTTEEPSELNATLSPTEVPQLDEPHSKAPQINEPEVIEPESNKPNAMNIAPSTELALISVDDATWHHANGYCVDEATNKADSFTITMPLEQDASIGIHFVAGVTGTRYTQQEGLVPPVIHVQKHSPNHKTSPVALEAGSQVKTSAPAQASDATTKHTRKKGLKRFEELVQLAQAGDLPLTDSQRQAFVEELLLKECQMTKDVLDHMITSYFNHDDGINWDGMNDIKNEAAC